MSFQNQVSIDSNFSLPRSNADVDFPLNLSYIRGKYFSGDFTLDAACHFIDVKRDFASYVVFSRVLEDGFKEYSRSKCAFRGNDIYKARVWNRHKDLLTFCELNKDKSFIVRSDNSGFVSNVLKFTLTVDPKRFSRNDFNRKYCSYYYDIFVKRIRNHYPGVVVARSYEVSTKRARGYLHINIIAVFPDFSFSVYLHKSKKHFNWHGKPVTSWRLRDYSLKKEFSNFWECGFIDVRAVTDSNDLAEYCLKYYIKDFTRDSNKSTQVFTNDVLTLFNKRGFSFPRASKKRDTADFYDTVVYFVSGLNSETPVLFPRLDIIKHNSLTFECGGFFIDTLGNYDSDIWYKVLTELPPELDPAYSFDVFDLNPMAVKLCSFDSGSCLVDGSYRSAPSFEFPKYTKQKKFRTGLFYDRKANTVSIWSDDL